MSDTARAYIAVSGGVIAILIALASSLSIGPGPIFTFDKVVVGALLVGGLGALQVSVNIGNTPEARAERMAKAAMKMPLPPLSPSSWEQKPINYPIKREPIERKLAAESAVSEMKPMETASAPKRQIAEGGPSF